MKISQCRICSSETAILTAAEEEEYNVLKEHVTFCKESGQLHAKYPFKKDPGILLDNGREAKACQISQERRQIKNGTHDQYVDQFKDMVSRNVVSEISDKDKATYIGPVNYITHHEVYKPGSLSTPIRLVSKGPRDQTHRLIYLRIF